MQAGEVKIRRRTGQGKKQMNCEIHCMPVSSTLFITVHFNLKKGLVTSLKLGGWKNDSTGPFYLDSLFSFQGFIISHMQDQSHEDT